MKENQLDAIDTRILEELTTDARIPLVQLAKKLKVSNTLVHQRVGRLKERGFLKQAVYRVDPLKLGYETSAYILIIINHPRDHQKVEEKLKEIPEIVECHNIVGRYELMVKIYARNNRHLREIIYEKIQPIAEIEGTNTMISFETVFQRSLPVGL